MQKRPSLKQLEYFVCLAKHLNFRTAAAELGVSQPTLTKQISTLEENLLLTLFERSRTGTLLSPQGKDLLAHAKRCLETTKNLMDTADLLAHGRPSTYTLGVPPTLGPYLLPFILPTLHRRYTDLKFYVREAIPRQLEELLMEGELDLIISPLPLVSSEIVIEPLCTEPLKLVVPSQHEFANQGAIAPEQINGQNVLILEEQHHFHREVQNICEKYRAKVQRDFEGTSLDTLRQMVVMEIGIAFLPGLYVHSELHRPEDLHVCELHGSPISREHALAWRNSAANRSFFREIAFAVRSIIKDQLSGIVKVSDQ